MNIKCKPGIISKSISSKIDDAEPMSSDAPNSVFQVEATRTSVRKLSQKGLYTLFVNGIPHRSNRKEALLAHFKMLGEVINIYIPMNSERAFVQFSNREEAEASLRARDVVMGNRFIKLCKGNGAIVTLRGKPPTFVPSHPVGTDRRKDNHQSEASRITKESSPSKLSKSVIADAP
ncbi:RNA recognition motif [Medicago truncatula]|uniref:RNA recognition motif n=1 Tax=Medicago truncatula TaxID=3880 RepID=A0A072V7T5_MEDTR|nr:RNA recognition motif [Medicago truncatula]